MANTAQDHSAVVPPAVRRFQITDANAWLAVTPPSQPCRMSLTFVGVAGRATFEGYANDATVDTAISGDHFQAIPADETAELRLENGEGAAGNSAFQVSAASAGVEVQALYETLGRAR